MRQTRDAFASENLSAAALFRFEGTAAGCVCGLCLAVASAYVNAASCAAVAVGAVILAGVYGAGDMLVFAVVHNINSLKLFG